MRRLKRSLGLLVLLVAGATIWVVYPPPTKTVVFPNGKRFAFSIIDDTDMTTLELIRPIYAVLEKYGLRTTKTVWVYDSSDDDNPANKGDSLQNADYRAFILDLQRKGFEIALHGVRGGSSRREEIARGLEDFKHILGQYPAMQVNNSTNAENLYWGRHLFTFTPYQWLGKPIFRDFSGHDPQSPYFWGDLAQKHIRYVRRFTFSDPNLLAVNPTIPYQLPDKPFVNYWFPTSNGNRVIEFHELLKPENLARLEREGGVCLVYSHLGSGSFNKGQTVDPRFEERIRELSAHNGWFAPASEILDYLRQQPSWTGALSLRERIRMDTKFVFARVVFGTE
jgi:hypothetical protein